MAAADAGSHGHARVIVRWATTRGAELARRHRLPLLRQLAAASVVEVDAASLAALSRDPDVAAIVEDRLVGPSVSTADQATRADVVRAGQPGGLLGLGGYGGVTGRGITVAVVDSGISTTHAALAGKVIAAVSLVPGDPGVDDRFGHGTHVAGLIAGAAAPAAGVTGEYRGGIAPGASLVNVRVLGADGLGYTSDVIAGIDWVIANRSRYRIRVVNLSLGHPIGEPALFDPLVDAVTRAVDAGLVVVAAAGNYGLTADGHPALGTITSPGNAPAALTVGALDMQETAVRGDDAVTPYSSRGPTMFDQFVKPDVVAPGHRLVSLEAPGSALVASYPALHAAGAGTNAYARLSGTSMATAVVSGGVTLMLEAAPGLTPAHVKLALQSGASFVRDAGLLAAGAGSVDFWHARRVASDGLVSKLLDTITSPAAPGGLTWRSDGAMIPRLYGGSGLSLLGPVQALLAWLNPASLPVGRLGVLGAGNPLALLPPAELLYGEVYYWSGGQNIVWGFQGPVEGANIVWGFSTPATER
ncbi:MAG: S8 family serine peptidase [Vicinamibacterales bacterium]